MRRNKEIKLVSSPETEPAWPIPPEYVPLWDYQKIEAEVLLLITHYGHEAMPVLKLEDVIELMLEMSTDYDLALARAQRNEWALQGMLKSE